MIDPSEDDYLLRKDDREVEMVNFPSLNSFNDQLLDDAFLQNLVRLLRGYAEREFIIIKKETNFRQNEKTQLYELLASEESSKIEREINSHIYLHENLNRYRDFLGILKRARLLIAYFITLNSRAQGSERVVNLGPQERYVYLQNAFALRAVLKEIPDGDLQRYAFPNERLYEKRVRSENVIMVDPDGCEYKMVRRSWPERIFSYLYYNPKKLFFSGFLGAAAMGAALYFLWPVTVTTFATIVTITGTLAVTALVSSAVTALINLWCSESARNTLGAWKRVVIEQKPLNIQPPTNHSETGELPSEDVEVEEGCHQLVSLILCFGTLLPKSLLLRQTKSSLISIIKTNLSVQRFTAEAVKKIITEYYTGSKFFLDLDLPLIQNACQRNIPSLIIDPGLINNIKLGLVNARNQKLNLLLAQSGNEDHTISNIAFTYWRLLKSDPLKARLIRTLFSNLYPDQKNALDLMIEQQKSSLVLFVKELVENKTGSLRDDDLKVLITFTEAIHSKNILELTELTQRLDIFFPGKYFDGAFIHAMINNSEKIIDFEKDVKRFAEKQVSHDFSEKDTIVCFLKLAGVQGQLDLVTKKYLINHLFQTLQQLRFDEIIDIVSDIRFCTYARINLPWLINFIVNYFEFNGKIQEKKDFLQIINADFQTKQYIDKNITPFLKLIVEIIDRLGKQKNNSISERSKASKIMEIFFKHLSTISAEEVNALNDHIKELPRTRETNLASKLINLYYGKSNYQMLPPLSFDPPHDDFDTGSSSPDPLSVATSPTHN